MRVEDFYNSSSTSPMSSVPVQFLVHVVSLTTCAINPVIYGIPDEFSCTPVQVGVPFKTIILAQNNCPISTNITEISTLSLPDLATNPINTALVFMLPKTTSAVAQGLELPVQQRLQAQQQRSQLRQRVQQQRCRLRQRPQLQAAARKFCETID
ncbi:unnamed protein product [Didymodactylos carnosus]|uniref:Uncharacterized protein n=1 Tax=Didymodactylos carnosus TaxID=1234261 RepID=A0A8S2IYR7_9BILA|nr:unnamed protein product [Didymodactylos carnosus]CAF3771084.1 unnamed protein product [Didymodactylos carnosus]